LECGLKTITKIEDVKIIDSKPRSNRQQLSNWGVSKKQIDTWIASSAILK
jgi:hypothetical protein